MSDTNPKLFEALKWLACAADEDCPSAYRTEDFNEALENARNVINQAKGSEE